MTARAASTPIGGMRIGISTPAVRKASSCSRQRVTGPEQADRIQEPVGQRILANTAFHKAASSAYPMARNRRWKKGNVVNSARFWRAACA